MSWGVLFSCKKIDTNNATESNDISKFFLLPKNASHQTIQIAEELKRQNELTGFVSAIIKKEGYPFWNKVQVRISSQFPDKTKREYSTSSIQGDSLVFIPLVLDNTEYVNSFIVARFSNTGLILQLFRGREYKDFAYGGLNVTTNTAEKFALQIMSMDYDIFGRTQFLIKDHKLFNHHNTLTLTTNIADKLLTFSKGVLEEVTTCTYIQEQDECPYVVCDGPGGTCDGCIQCVGGDWYCESTWQTYFEPPLPDLTGGGGGGGSNPTTYSLGGPYPCNPNPLIVNGLIPCEDGNSTGWTYLLSTTVPCDPYIGTLKNDTYFTSIFQYLNNTSVISADIETGFLINRAVTPYPQQTGVNINEPTITWVLPPGTKYDGFLHSHNCPNPPTTCAASIFSPQDVLFMAQVFLYGLAKDSNNLFMGMTNSTGKPYLIKISNTSSFRTFAENLLMNEKSQKSFFDTYNPLLRSTNPDTNEENFLKMLKEKGIADGIDLFRGNNACNKWRKLNLSPLESVLEGICQ
jgi:hypothetical protein